MNRNHIIPFFHRLGNTAWLTEFSKSIFKALTIASSQFFSILIDMSSWPGALFISKDLIVFRISLPETVIDSREKAVTYDLLGSTELLTTGEHCQLKNSLKWLAFSLRSETYSLLFEIGVIRGTFLLLQKDLKMVQHFLMLKHLSLSWLERF